MKEGVFLAFVLEGRPKKKIYFFGHFFLLFETAHLLRG
jgi:hypothetical protein